MTVRVLSASSYLQPVKDGDGLPSLDQALKAVCREHFRRIDRFIKLALLGSARCAAGQELRNGCGVYLGSGFGPIASNVAVQEQMLRDAELPKPFDFVNTLGVSAGFYVAKNLELTGQNLCISRRGASFEAALAAALADLEMGVVEQALLGVVEEVNLPLDQHRLRRGLAADTKVAEGSHWLLLERDADGRKNLQLRRFDDLAEVEGYLQAHYRPGDRCHWTLEDDAEAITVMKQRFIGSTGGGDGVHDCPQAAWVTQFVTGGAAGNLFLVGSRPERGYSLLHLGA